MLTAPCWLADTVVIAMGPWSGVAAQWLPLPAVTGLKGHSITLQPDAHAIPAQALFVEYITATGRTPGARSVSAP